MALVNTPFLSVGASGTLYGFLTAESRAGTRYVYRKKICGGLQKGSVAGFGRVVYGALFYGYTGVLSRSTHSGLQGARRAIFSAGRGAWRALDVAEKREYTERAAPLQLTGALLYMREYLRANAL